MPFPVDMTRARATDGAAEASSMPRTADGAVRNVRRRRVHEGKSLRKGAFLHEILVLAITLTGISDSV